MVCPRCGSRDVLSSSNPKLKIVDCECQRCGNEWLQDYDPSNKPENGLATEVK